MLSIDFNSKGGLRNASLGHLFQSSLSHKWGQNFLALSIVILLLCCIHLLDLVHNEMDSEGQPGSEGKAHPKVDFWIFALVSYQALEKS